MGKVGSFFKKIFLWVTKVVTKAGDAYENLNEKLKPLVPVAVNVVQAIKKVTTDDPKDTILMYAKMLCPVDAGDLAIEAAYKWLKKKGIPKLLTTLQISEAVLKIQDKDKQFVAILAALNVSESKSQAYLDLASGILEAISDGKITFAEAKDISDYYYNNFVKE